ncbi:DUF481 domain-containing protein [Paludibaculum fermentans]|uniref:DUF481 domain-containing protein n=1 Tax=Paludibaculum fermentans TaxID=1473598 RepID=UPI003EC0284F
MKKAASLSFLLVCGLAATLFGDQITLKNGDRVSGKIVMADDKTVLLKTDYAGEIKIDRASITNMVTDQVLNVTLKDAGKVQGKVETTAEGVQVQKTDGTAVTVKPEVVTNLRNDASQKAYEREEERLHHPRLNDFWAGFVSLGIANSSGNSITTTVSTAASATRIAGKNKLSLNFAQLYATQSTTLPHGQTANKVSGGLRIDRDLSKRLFVYGTNGYDYDKFQDLDLRVVVGGGFGDHVWIGKKGYLDVFGGGNWNREKYNKDGVNITRQIAEVVVGQEMGYQALSKLKLYEKLTIFPNMSDGGQYRMNFDATASVPVMKWLELNFGFSDRFISNPVFGNKGNDTIFTTGVRVSFDQNKR